VSNKQHFKLCDYFSPYPCFVQVKIHWYFFRGVFVEALISAGEELENHAKSSVDIAIGLLAQAIGFWWGGPAHEKFCVQACQTVLGRLNKAADVR